MSFAQFYCKTTFQKAFSVSKTNKMMIETGVLKRSYCLLKKIGTYFRKGFVCFFLLDAAVTYLV